MYMFMYISFKELEYYDILSSGQSQR